MVIKNLGKTLINLRGFVYMIKLLKSEEGIVLRGG